MDIANIDTAVAAWRKRRSSLTHDWLRQRFLPRVQGCLTLSQGDANASARIVDTFAATLREWPCRRVEALKLVDEFAEVMSPIRTVEDIAPALTTEGASFLRFTAMELWKLRHRAGALEEEARAAYHATDDAFRAWDRDASPASLQTLAIEGERLARALSNLPSRVAL